MAKHDLGSHEPDTLANFNAKVSDGTLVDATAGIATSIPDPGTAGRYYFSTDTKVWSRDNGTTWDDVTSNGGTPATHATSHQNGGADEVATATPTANSIPKTAALTTLDKDWIPSLVGATASVAGTKGIPAGAAAGEQAYILTGGANWVAPDEAFIEKELVEATTSVTVGTKRLIRIPEALDGLDIVDVSFGVVVPGVGGTSPTADLTLDVLKRAQGTASPDTSIFSALPVIQITEFDTLDGIPGTLKTDTTITVAHGDLLVVKCTIEGATTTPPKGLHIAITFRSALVNNNLRYEQVSIDNTDSPYSVPSQSRPLMITADTSTAVVTANLPVTPKLGQRVAFRRTGGNDFTADGGAKNIVHNKYNTATTLLWYVDEDVAELEYNGTEWVTVVDKFHKHVASMFQGADTNLTHNSSDPVAFNGSPIDPAGLSDLGNNWYKIKRAGRYQVTMYPRQRGAWDDQTYFRMSVLVGGSATTITNETTSQIVVGRNEFLTRNWPPAVFFLDLAKDDQLTFNVYQSSVDTGTIVFRFSTSLMEQG